MQYIELKQKLKDFTVFSLNDIKKIDINFYRRRLNEWQKKGYIIKEKLIKHCKNLDLKLLAKDVKQFLFFPDEAKK